MDIIEKIMSWFGGKVTPLDEVKKQMPNHEPEERKVVERYVRKVYSDGRGGMTEVVEKVNPKEITTTDETLEKIVQEKGLKQQSDPKALEALIDKIINDNREKAIEYKNGKEKLFGFFVGQAMKASGGKANPQLINEILKKKL